MWFRDSIIPSDLGLTLMFFQWWSGIKRKRMSQRQCIFAGCHASHVAFIQAIKVDLILLLYRFETNTTSKARCPKCCWLSLPPSLWSLPSISQPGSHWTHDPSPCGMMRPSLVFSCTGGYTQCQVLEQNGSGTTGRLETLRLWSSWKRITHQTFNILILLQCSGQNFLTQMFGPSY